MTVGGLRKGIASACQIKQARKYAAGCSAASAACVTIRELPLLLGGGMGMLSL